MKIMILGSMTFAEDMLKIKEALEGFGHVADMPFNAEKHVEDEGLIDDLDRNAQYCIEGDVIRKGFQLHEPPSHHDHRWAHEVRIIQPVILHGDITRIKPENSST